MQRFFVLEPVSNLEYQMGLNLPPDLHLDERAIRWGQIQFINDEDEVIPLQQRSKYLPDLYRNELPLISDRLKDLFDDADVNNIFYKPIWLEDGERYLPYFLPVIRPITCVDWRKSRGEMDAITNCQKITGEFYIDVAKTGNFKIFKLKDAVNDFWIINDALKKELEVAQLRGVKLIETTLYQEQES